MKVLVIGILILTIATFFSKSISPSDNSILLECQTLPASYERLNCLKPYFEQLTIDDSAKAAIKEALRLKEIGIIDDCHLASHYIGEVNLKKQKDVGLAFATCTKGCIEGCFHGVMESYITQNNLNLDQIPQFCDSVSNDPILKRQCLHGVGHGIMRHSANSLLGSIEICQKFPDSFSVDTCIDGVLMENMDNYLNLSEDSLSKKLPEICQPLLNKEELMIKCMKAIGEGLMFYTGHNEPRSISFCQILDPKYQQFCIDSAKQEAILNQRN